MDSTEPFLEIFPPEGGEPKTVPLTKTRITIGRDPSCNDIALQPDPRQLVSREEHCFLTQQGSYWYIGSDGSKLNPTFLSRGGRRCVVQNNILLTDGSRIYIQGEATEAGEPLFWQIRFHDPQGTQPGQVAPYLAYEQSNHRLFRVVRGISEAIQLSPHEDRLFRCLWIRSEEQHAPALVPTLDLMQAIWGAEATTHETSELHRLIASLHKKIELDSEKPRFVRNSRGHGYVLDVFPLPDFPDEIARNNE